MMDELYHQLSSRDCEVVLSKLQVVLSEVSNKLNDLEGNEQKIREWR